MDANADLIALPELPGVLLAKFDLPADPAATAATRRRLRYRTIWEAAVAGEIGAVRRGRSLFVRRDDLPRIAEMIGLRPRRPGAAPTDRIAGLIEEKAIRA